MKCENKLSFEPYNRGLIQSCMTGSYPVGIRRRTGMQPFFPNAKNIVLKQLSSSTFH